MELNSLLVDSIATFSCDVGCKLSHPNNSQIICMPNEEWSSQPPTCEGTYKAIMFSSVKGHLISVLTKIKLQLGFRFFCSGDLSTTVKST